MRKITLKNILKGDKNKTRGGVQKLPRLVTEGLQDTQNKKGRACRTSLNINV